MTAVTATIKADYVNISGLTQIETTVAQDLDKLDAEAVTQGNEVLQFCPDCITLGGQTGKLGLQLLALSRPAVPPTAHTAR